MVAKRASRKLTSHPYTTSSTLDAESQGFLQKVESEFKKRLPTYNRLKDEASYILEAALKKEGIKIHSITSRIKEPGQLVKKMERYQLTRPFSQVHDIVGLRVVCLFLTDVTRVGDAIRDSFDVSAEDDKVEGYDASRFGYMSVHFDVKIRKTDSGPRYIGLHDIPFEIQVRTIAMEAWATISHYLDYKTDEAIPDELKKDFYALSGLFYVADKHFQMFFKSGQASRQRIAQAFSSSRITLVQPINHDTLSAYLRTRFPDRKHTDPKSVSELASTLSKAGFTSIREVDEVVQRGRKAFLQYEKYVSKRTGVGPKYFWDVGVLRVTMHLVSPRFERIEGVRRMYSKYRRQVKKQ